jgi:WD40 repeat protein
MTFSADSSVLVFVTADHLAHLWNWQTNKKESHFALHHSGHIHTLVCSGEYVLTMSAENGVRIWDQTTGLLITALSQTKTVLVARFSPKATFILTGSRDGTADIWETATGHQLASIAHEHEVYAVAWSEDERAVVTACRDQHIRLWLWQPEDLITKAALRLTRNLTHEEWSHYIGNEPYQKTFSNLVWREREPENIE